MSIPIWADFRSDACTLPSQCMRDALARADVGNDDFSEDPTVLKLEQSIAELLGKPSALFVQSGTMGNLAALMSVLQPGDSLLTSPNFHVSYWEGDAVRRVVGTSFRHCTDTTAGPHTLLDLTSCDRLLDSNSNGAGPCGLFSIESPVNQRGGSVLPLEHLRDIRQWSSNRKLHLHLDGARFFNAAIAMGVSASELATCADSITVSFNKGVGAPAGAAVVGSTELIERARRYRWMLGGAWKQGGVLAAACLVGLESAETRMLEDHRRARNLAIEINSIPGLEVGLAETVTNMVMLRVVDPRIDLSVLESSLVAEGIRIGRFKEGRVSRLMTHSDITWDSVQRFIATLKRIVLLA